MKPEAGTIQQYRYLESVTGYNWMAMKTANSENLYRPLRFVWQRLSSHGPQAADDPLDSLKVCTTRST